MRKLWFTMALLGLTACDLAPDFNMPELAVPEVFKEASVAPNVAEPAEPNVEPASDGKWKRVDDKARIEEFAWWRMFHDEALNTLQEQAMKDSPSLEVAAERVNRARATARVVDAELYPQITAGVGPTIQRNSPGGIKPASFAYVTPHTIYNARGTISYELDIFRKNRNADKAANLQAEGEENNFRAARLSLQAEVAQTYFQLAALRSEAALLADTVKTRKKALELTRKKRDVGAVDDVAVSTAETDLANVESEQASVLQQQALQEHALAILVGKPPASLVLNEVKLGKTPPVIPAGMPSALLERRPDIHAAVKNMAAANASIGAARAGYFPDITLSASGGFSSGELDQLFNWSNRTWMIGPLAGTMLTQPIFQGGAVSARVAQRRSDFASSVASYRQSVLQAFREVEDNLSDLRHLSDRAAASAKSLKSAQRTFDMVNKRYQVGSVSYLEQLDAQRSLLAAQRNSVQVLGNRYVSTVQLVKALGGSWEAAPEQTKVENLPALKPITEPAADVKPAPETSVMDTWVDSVASAFDAEPAPVNNAPEAVPAVVKNNESLPPAELPVVK